MKLDLDNAQASDYDSLDAHSMDTMVMDGIQDQEYTEWSNDRWPSQWGYFNQVPELKNAILLKSIWVCGKGYEVEDSKTKAILNNVDGCGKDTFRLLLYNQDVIRRVGGDSYAEVIRDPESGEFRNLKPLDPGTMKNVFDRSGRVVKYQQLTPYPTKGFLNQIKGNAIKNWLGKRKVSAEFKPHEIFHLMNNRLGSQTHGISDIDSIEDTILADDKSFKDMEKIVRFQAKPFILFKLKTDNEAKITAFANKIRSMRNLGEDCSSRMTRIF